MQQGSLLAAEFPLRVVVHAMVELIGRHVMQKGSLLAAEYRLYTQKNLNSVSHTLQ